jgi:signal transduction histidine kinase
VVVPLLLDGLSKNERCLYLGDGDTITMVRAALASHGVDVEGLVARSALVFSSDRPPDDAAFDPQAMVGMLVDAIDEAVRAGFSGLCATGDMRWELGRDQNFDRLLEYEALLEGVFREKPLRGICQYRRDTVPPQSLQDALLAHQSVYVGAHLNRDNLFYVPPELLLGDSGSRDALGQWMCDQLTRIMAAERSRDHALDALAETNRELERRVQQRTAELEAVNKELEAFSYSVSHDLRAPVRHVDGYARILETEFPASLGDEGTRYLQRIREAAAHMSALIDGMLALGRVAKSELNVETIDLGALAADIVAELRKADPARHVDVVIDPGLLVRGDRTLLRAALDNLIGNAWKFTARRELARIEVRGGTTTAGFRTLRISDNGAGFDMTYADRLFGMFRRLHRQEEFAGTGVGLATVQRIVHRHSGKIWCEGAVDQGATFFFTLPAADKPVAPH